MTKEFLDFQQIKQDDDEDEDEEDDNNQNQVFEDLDNNGIDDTKQKFDEAILFDNFKQGINLKGGLLSGKLGPDQRQQIILNGAIKNNLKIPVPGSDIVRYKQYEQLASLAKNNNLSKSQVFKLKNNIDKYVKVNQNRFDILQPHVKQFKPRTFQQMNRQIIMPKQKVFNAREYNKYDDRDGDGINDSLQNVDAEVLYQNFIPGGNLETGIMGSIHDPKDRLEAARQGIPVKLPQNWFKTVVPLTGSQKRKFKLYQKLLQQAKANRWNRAQMFAQKKNIDILIKQNQKQLDLQNEHIDQKLGFAKGLMNGVTQTTSGVVNLGQKLVSGPINTAKGTVAGINGLLQFGQGNYWNAFGQLTDSASYLTKGALGTLGTGAAIYAARKLYNKKKQIQKKGITNTLYDYGNRLADQHQLRMEKLKDKFNNVGDTILQVGSAAGDILLDQAKYRVLGKLSGFQTGLKKLIQSPKTQQQKDRFKEYQNKLELRAQKKKKQNQQDQKKLQILKQKRKILQQLQLKQIAQKEKENNKQKQKIQKLKNRYKILKNGRKAIKRGKKLRKK